MERNGQNEVQRNDQVGTAKPDPEVVPKAMRRRFNAAYKERILKAADACAEPGDLGACSASAELGVFQGPRYIVWARKEDIHEPVTTGQLHGGREGRHSAGGAA